MSVYYTSPDIIYLTLISALENYLEIWERVEVRISFEEKNTNVEYTCLDQYIDNSYEESSTVNGEWLQGLLVMEFHLFGKKESRIDTIEKEEIGEDNELNKFKKNLNNLYTVNQLLMKSEGGSWTASKNNLHTGQRRTILKSTDTEISDANHIRNSYVNGYDSDDYKNRKRDEIAQNTAIIEYNELDQDVFECWIPCAAFLPVKNTECSITLKVQFDPQSDS